MLVSSVVKQQIQKESGDGKYKKFSRRIGEKERGNFNVDNKMIKVR